jgi:hypothetical protein
MPFLEWEFNWNPADGKLNIVGREDFINALKIKFKKNCIITAKFESGTGEKSRPMEKYYWGIVIPIQQSYYGIDSPDWMHEINLYQHAPRLHEGFEGKELTPYKRTSDKEGSKLKMNREEQVDFIKNVIFDEQTKGHDIPEPNEYI